MHNSAKFNQKGSGRKTDIGDIVVDGHFSSNKKMDWFIDGRFGAGSFIKKIV